jgi:hypothetical protein
MDPIIRRDVVPFPFYRMQRNTGDEVLEIGDLISVSKGSMIAHRIKFQGFPVYPVRKGKDDVAIWDGSNFERMIFCTGTKNQEQKREEDDFPDCVNESHRIFWLMINELFIN